MHPEIHPHWPAVLASVVASFVLGGLWYGPLFGNAWAKAMGFDRSQKCPGSEMLRAFGLNIVGTFLMAFVLAHDVAVWRPSTWGVGADQAPQVYGFFAGFFVWLGFIVPIQLNEVAFSKRSWKVFGIHAGYQFLSLQAMAMILAFWR